MSKRNITTSILGDSGATEATVVPNLESLNTGQDNYLTSISDTSEFNVYQQMKIYDNFWDTQFAEHIVNSVNAGTVVSSAVIQGNTEGWVRADHMALQVPFEITYNIRCFSNRFDANTPSLGGVNLTEARSSLTRYLNDLRLATAYHPRYAFLDCFNRLKLLLGNNGQQIQKTAETQPLGLKHHMATHRYGDIVGGVMACWGLRNSHTRLVTGNYNAIRNATYAINPNQNTLWGWKGGHMDLVETWDTDDDAHAYYRFLQSGVSTLYGNISAVFRNDTVTPKRGTVTERACYEVKTVRQLVLPLQCIIPFFRGAKYLPPDFRFKFELESAASKYICQSSRAFEDQGYAIADLHARANATINPEIVAAVAIGGADYTPYFPLGTNLTTAAGTTFVANPVVDDFSFNKDFFITAQMRLGDVRLHYPWHILRQPVQAAISTMWLQKPFLYNYETVELLENVFINGQRTINVQVAISSQRPTELTAYLVGISNKNFGSAIHNQCDLRKKTFAAGGIFANSLEYTFWGGFGSNDPYIDPVIIADSPTCYGQLQGPDAPPVQWQDLEIRFSGRTGYRFRNDYQGANLFGEINNGVQNFMCNLWSEQSYRSYATEVNNSCKQEKDAKFNSATHWNGLNANELIHLVIQPGGWTDRGIISSRQGATTIQLVITFKVALSSETKLCIFRKNPEQFVFDSDKNVTIIQWPAVKNNTGYLLPNVTAAP